MEDSPLSITASITGILTFLAAICAFIYVRYKTLTDGWTEFYTVMESVAATIEETKAIAHPRPSTHQPDDRPDPNELKKLVEELYTVEISILVGCSHVLNGDLRTARPELSPGRTSATWNDVLQEVTMTQKQWQHRRKGLSTAFNDYLLAMSSLVPSNRPVLTLPLRAMTFILGLGITPQMLRWYMVREKVMKKIQQRERIRSRLLFRQMSIANSLIRSQKPMIEHLIRENEDHRSELSQLRSFAIDTHHVLERLERGNDEVKMLILDLKKAQNHHERSSTPVNTEYHEG